MCGCMVDIQSPTAEIMRGKKRRTRRNHSMKIYIACPITQGGHKLIEVDYSKTNQSVLINHLIILINQLALISYLLKMNSQQLVS